MRCVRTGVSRKGCVVSSAGGCWLFLLCCGEVNVCVCVSAVRVFGSGGNVAARVCLCTRTCLCVCVWVRRNFSARRRLQQHCFSFLVPPVWHLCPVPCGCDRAFHSHQWLRRHMANSLAARADSAVFLYVVRVCVCVCSGRGGGAAVSL